VHQHARGKPAVFRGGDGECPCPVTNPVVDGQARIGACRVLPALLFEPRLDDLPVELREAGDARVLGEQDGSDQRIAGHDGKCRGTQFPVRDQGRRDGNGEQRYQHGDQQQQSGTAGLQRAARLGIANGDLPPGSAVA
jgi:hypothetical protein